MDNLLSKNIVSDIKQLILNAQQNAVRAVNHERVLLYWNIGCHIVEEEQKGKQRADYGTYLLKVLSNELTREFGNGFSARQLDRCRQFYNVFPISSTLRTELNWTQYKLLLSISDEDKRTYYIE